MMSQAELPIFSARGENSWIRKAFTSGYFENIAKREKNTY